MTDRWYVLDGKTPKPVGGLEDWARWMQTGDRHVAQDLVGDVRISTVFLGLDHSHVGGDPLLFETMIFGGPHDGHQTRASTWDEAEAQHAEAVAMARAGRY